MAANCKQNEAWCKSVSNRPFRHFLANRAVFGRLRASLGVKSVTPPGIRLKHKSPEQIGKVTLMLDLIGCLVYVQKLTADSRDWSGHQSLIDNPKADMLLLLPQTKTGFRRDKFLFYKRPAFDEFLQQVAPLFECIVFTSSSYDLATAAVNHLDRDGAISYVLARAACTAVANESGRDLLFKDISAVGRDPARTVIVDDCIAGCVDRANVIQLPEFNPNCSEWQMRGSIDPKAALTQLLPLLQRLANYGGDVRVFLDQVKRDPSYPFPAAAQSQSSSPAAANAASAS